MHAKLLARDAEPVAGALETELLEPCHGRLGDRDPQDDVVEVGDVALLVPNEPERETRFRLGRDQPVARVGRDARRLEPGPHGLRLRHPEHDALEHPGLTSARLRRTG